MVRAGLATLTVPSVMVEGEGRALVAQVRWNDADAVYSLRSGGDRKALWQLLYDRHAGTVMRVGARVTGCGHTACDILQTVFLKAMEKIGTLDRPEAFRCWLLTMAHNEALQHLRRAGRECSLPEDGLSFVPDEVDPAARFCEQQMLSAIKSRLEGAERSCWILRYEQHLSYNEISLAMALPLNTVRSHLRRARKRIQDDTKLKSLLALIAWLVPFLGGAL